MDADRVILTSGLVIIGVGVAGKLSGTKKLASKSYTNLIIGGVGFTLLASLLAMTNPQVARVVAGLTGLAAVTVVLVNGQPLLDLLSQKRSAAGKPQERQ